MALEAEIEGLRVITPFADDIQTVEDTVKLFWEASVIKEADNRYRVIKTGDIEEYEQLFGCIDMRRNGTLIYSCYFAEWKPFFDSTWIIHYDAADRKDTITALVHMLASPQLFGMGITEYSEIFDVGEFKAIHLHVNGINEFLFHADTLLENEIKNQNNYLYLCWGCVDKFDLFKRVMDIENFEKTKIDYKGNGWAQFVFVESQQDIVISLFSIINK